MNLDQFKNNIKSKDYELNGKTYRADLSAFTILKMNDDKRISDGTPSEQVLALFENVFGTENTKEILETITVKGIEAVASDITKIINPNDNSGK